MSEVDALVLLIALCAVCVGVIVYISRMETEEDDT